MEQEKKKKKTDDFPKDKLIKDVNKEVENCVILAVGAFSPITFAHLRMLEIAKDWCQQRKYQVLGGYISPVNDGYGKKGLAEAKDRINMCHLALESSNWIMVDEWEARQDQNQLTIKVINHFVEEINKIYSNTKIFLVCGADLIESFSIPGNWSPEDTADILESCSFICIEREGSSAIKTIYDHEVLFKYEQKIHCVPNLIPNEVSSTRIRQAVSRGLSIRYLIPDLVVDYIEKNNLFKK